MFLGRVKFIWYVSPGAKVHFIWSLSMESRVRKIRVVLLDIKRNQLFDGANSIEGIQEQPLVFEGSPPGFDERVGV